MRRFFLLALLCIACPAHRSKSSTEATNPPPPPAEKPTIVPVACPVECSGIRKPRDCTSIPSDSWDAGELAYLLSFDDVVEYDSFPLCGAEGNEIEPNRRLPVDRALPAEGEEFSLRGRFDVDFEVPRYRPCSDFDDVEDLGSSNAERAQRSEFETVCKQPDTSPTRRALFSPHATKERADSLRLHFVTKIEIEAGDKVPLRCHHGQVARRVAAQSDGERFAITHVDENAPAPGLERGLYYAPDECCSIDSGAHDVLLLVRMVNDEIQVLDMCQIPSDPSP